MSEINVYKEQLLQIQQALALCDNDEDRANLISLEKDLNELVSLSNDGTKGDEISSSSGSSSSDEDDQDQCDDLKELYQNLINEKCRAPFKAKNQIGESFHNAFIADILSATTSGEVIVKVFFLNPTQDRMKACEHFFNNRCEYNEKCKYSHGESVAYSSLKAFQSPNYSMLKKRSHVMVKTESSLWKPASVIECSQDLKTCQIKLHNSTKILDIPFSEILPPIESTSDSSDLSTDDDNSDKEGDRFPSRNVLQIGENFGEWEKFTTGFGSKMLRQMGFVDGNGLGKKGDGIRTPVSAKIYVQGKSLDYNMTLNEKKNRDTVEERLKRQSLAQQKRSEKNYAKRESQVFDFLNTISNIKPSTSDSKIIVKKTETVKSQSKEQLNLNSFKYEEDIKKLSQTIQRLKDSMKRLSKDSIAHKNLQRQVNENEFQLENLHKTLSTITHEQNSRKEKNKLTIF